jgi:hypothetical protein
MLGRRRKGREVLEIDFPFWKLRRITGKQGQNEPVATFLGGVSSGYYYIFQDKIIVDISWVRSERASDEKPFWGRLLGSVFCHRLLLGYCSFYFWWVLLGIIIYKLQLSL